jgi:hypothetical protein
MTTMLEENVARLRAHQNNIRRYRRLLQTELSDLERAFIMRRLDEEQEAFQSASCATFPISFKAARPASSQEGDRV